MKVQLDICDYATEADLKNSREVDASEFAKRHN